MAHKTLKEKFVSKSEDIVFEHVAKIITESLIIEDVDKKTLTDAINTIKRLQTIDFGNVSILDKARDAAILDVTKMTSGQGQQGIMGKIASLFGKKDSAVYDALAFGSAIRNFFPLMGEFVESLGSKSGQTPDGSKTVREIAGSEDMSSALKGIITKNLKPTGVLQQLGTGWSKKYLQGTIDELAEQILDSSLNDLKKIGSSVSQATGNVGQVAQAAKDTASQPGATAEKPAGSADELAGKIKTAFSAIKADMGTISPEEKKIVYTTIKSMIDKNLLK